MPLPTLKGSCKIARYLRRISNISNIGIVPRAL
jgi:hypothetical protein